MWKNISTLLFLLLFIIWKVQHPKASIVGSFNSSFENRKARTNHTLSIFLIRQNLIYTRGFRILCACQPRKWKISISSFFLKRSDNYNVAFTPHLWFKQRIPRWRRWVFVYKKTNIISCVYVCRLFHIIEQHFGNIDAELEHSSLFSELSLLFVKLNCLRTLSHCIPTLLEYVGSPESENPLVVSCWFCKTWPSLSLA